MATVMLMNSYSYVLPLLMASPIVVMAQPVVAQVVLTADQINQQAASLTVAIEGVSSGSGVIVARMGTTYTVLTANHVVDAAAPYTIVTPDGLRYPIRTNDIQPLPGVDLAIVHFTSSQVYATATLASYQYDSRFRNVFVSGWTGPSGGRTRQFTAGVLSDRNFGLAQTQGIQRDGYNLFYSNWTDVGMSGGPILDTDGRVIGIHGLADGDVVDDRQTGGTTRVKRGFSAGIPISAFLNQTSRLNLGAIRVETAPPSRPTAQQIGTVSSYLTVSPLPTNASAADWTNQANQLYRVGRLSDALTALEQAIHLQPDFHLAWYERGNVLFAMKRSQEALQSYDRTLQIKPDFYSVWRDRGVLLAAMGQFEAALGSLDRATEVKPDDYVLWYMRGNLLTKDLRDYNRALVSYDRSLQIKPDFADAWTGKGKALYELGQYNAALIAFDRSLQYDASLAVAWMLKGRTFVAVGQRQAAIAAFQQALRLKPNDPEILRMLAAIRSPR